MEKYKITDWFTWGEWANIPWFHVCYVYGLALDLKKRSGSELKHVIADFDGKNQRIFISENEWIAAGEKYFKKVLSNPDILKTVLIRIEQAADILFALNQKLQTLNPSSLSPNEIGQWYKKFHDATHELWSSGMVPNLLEWNHSFLSDYLRQYIKMRAGRIVSQEEWQALITPLKLSYLQKEEIDFLKLVMKLGQNRRLTTSLVKEKSTRQLEPIIHAYTKEYTLFIAHYKKYCWTQYGWTGPALTKEYYLTRIQGILKQKDAPIFLKQILSEHRSHSKNQARAEKSLRLDRKHTYLLHLLRRLLHDKTIRVDALYQGYYSINPFIQSLSAHLKISLRHIYALHGEEILTLIKTKKLAENQANRIPYSVISKEDNKLIFFTGKIAKQKTAPILKTLTKKTTTKELQGQIAFAGVVRGKVKLVFSSKDIHKVKPGDVLISTVTDPSVLPAMKKAAAFVTDMGGLTAHAAIVARELRKPCIVGTKIATKIFKDNDLVKVDATKGIVKKL